MNLQENIRRILKEESLKQSLIDEIKTQGWFNVSQYVGGDEELKKITDIHNSRQFMKLFLDLKPKQSEYDPETILYKNDNGVNVFLYLHHYKNKDKVYMLYFNYDLVYKPLESFRETKSTGERLEFLQKWLKTNYDLNVNEWDIDNYRSGDRLEYLD